ncbi:MOSC domain-containing protein [Paenibacillus sp. 1P07SE]|uniref:MOSC domain-containing protein n=1 Tax=Paenibacillus sp. 1P07SE TaxID=3132209 RepID=UPI0039A5AA3C
MSETLGLIHAVQVGEPGQMKHGSKAVATAIVKRKVAGPRRVGKLGLPGDGQADLVNHGGADKAVCVYFSKHYPYWRHWLDKPLGDSPFGENLTIDGGDETMICIGDVLRIGSAAGPLVQVTQPRVPCFKLGLRHEQPQLPAQVLQTGYSGFYLRVLTEGEVEAGDAVVFERRDPAGVTVAEALRIMMIEREDWDGARRLLAIDALAESWREMALKRLAKAPGQEKER